MMKTTFAALTLGLACAAAQAETRSWNFRVLLDDRPIGQHQFRLVTNGETRELTSEAKFDVKVLFISAYRYQHEARERWMGDCLDTLTARTEINGERKNVQANTDGPRMTVQRPEGRDTHSGCVMTFAYWNPRILEATRLLNSQTGELLPVTVTREGEESLAIQGRPQRAERHRIRAPQMQIDVWYADGRWVALEAPAAGGRRLRYELM